MTGSATSSAVDTSIRSTRERRRESSRRPRRSSAARFQASRTPRDGLLGSLWYNVANYALRPWPWIAVGLASLVVLPSVIIEAPADGRITAFVDARRIPAELVVPASDREKGLETIATRALGLPDALEEGRAARFEWDPATSAVTGSLVASPDPIGAITVTASDGTTHDLPLAAFDRTPGRRRR